MSELLGETTPEGVPTGLEIRLQGAHMRQTFSGVYEDHKSYCRWVLLTVEQGEEMQNHQLLRLAA